MESKSHQVSWLAPLLPPAVDYDHRSLTTQHSVNPVCRPRLCDNLDNPKNLDNLLSSTVTSWSSGRYETPNVFFLGHTTPGLLAQETYHPYSRNGLRIQPFNYLS